MVTANDPSASEVISAYETSTGKDPETSYEILEDKIAFDSIAKVLKNLLMMIKKRMKMLFLISMRDFISSDLVHQGGSYSSFWKFVLAQLTLTHLPEDVIRLRSLFPNTGARKLIMRFQAVSQSALRSESRSVHLISLIVFCFF